MTTARNVIVAAVVAMLVAATCVSAGAAWTTSTSYSVVGNSNYQALVDPAVGITGIPLSVGVGSVYVIDIAGTVDSDGGGGTRQYGLSLGGQAGCATSAIDGADSIGTSDPKAIRVSYSILCVAADSDTRDYSFQVWGTYSISDYIASRAYVMAPVLVSLTSVPSLTSISIVPLVSVPSSITVTTNVAYLVAL